MREYEYCTECRSHYSVPCEHRNVFTDPCSQLRARQVTTHHKWLCRPGIVTTVEEARANIVPDFYTIDEFWETAIRDAVIGHAPAWRRVFGPTPDRAVAGLAFSELERIQPCVPFPRRRYIVNFTSTARATAHPYDDALGKDRSSELLTAPT